MAVLALKHPTVDGQPTQLRYSVGFSAPAGSEK
jgi:hypothetical protein